MPTAIRLLYAKAGALSVATRQSSPTSLVGVRSFEHLAGRSDLGLHYRDPATTKGGIAPISTS